jgi:hypothetical protein
MPDMQSAENDATAGVLNVEERFAIVPEWLLDADVSDAAIRLYAVLLRYGQSSGARMPGRATLARRLRKRSVDTIDRAMRELVAIGAVVVEHRYDGPQRLTNRYHLHARRPDTLNDAGHAASGGGRMNAATPKEPDQPDLAFAAGGGRKNAAGVAASVRHNPKHFTQSTTTSPQRPGAAPRVEETNLWRAEEDRFLETLGISDADGYTAEIGLLRRDAGGPSARWARPSLVAALQTAVKARGWPTQHAAHALRIVAADPATRSPMRLAEAGPWWDEAATTLDRRDGKSEHHESGREDAAAVPPLEQVEAELAEADGLRVHLQAQARAELRAERQPLTRATVLRRAHQLLQRRQLATATAT